MPWLTPVDDCADAAEARARMRKAKYWREHLNPPPPPPPPPPAPEPKAAPAPVVHPAVEPLRKNRVIPGQRIDLLDVNNNGRILMPSELDQPFISVNSVIKECCRYFNIFYVALTGDGRSGEMVIARQVTYYLLKKLTGASNPTIGAKLGRDHSTVIHGVRRVRTAFKMVGHPGELKSDKVIVTAALEIEKRILEAS